MRAVVLLVGVVSVLAAACGQPGSFSPTAPSDSVSPVTPALVGSSGVGALSGRNEHACWGEATQALARLGEMGYHASQQSNPRLGLHNVARLLYDLGLLPDDSLQALGAFLSSALGLSIDSCL